MLHAPSAFVPCGVPGRSFGHAALGWVMLALVALPPASAAVSGCVGSDECLRHTDCRDRFVCWEGACIAEPVEGGEAAPSAEATVPEDSANDVSLPSDGGLTEGGRSDAEASVAEGAAGDSPGEGASEGGASDARPGDGAAGDARPQDASDARLDARAADADAARDAGQDRNDSSGG